MPYFMHQWQYKHESLKALIERPHDRSEVAARAIEAHGGKLHQFFLSFGDQDGIAIAEYPDHHCAAAAALTVGAEGALSHIKTTLLLTPEESVSAMKMAGSVKSGYSAPGD